MMAASESLIFIGGGGHAKVLLDITDRCSQSVLHYVDPIRQPWLEAKGVSQLSEKELESKCKSHLLVMGFVGIDCASLQKRLALMQSYKSKGARFASLIHPSAIISESATLAEGVQILPGAIINAGAKVGEGAVINSGAIVEHDADVAAGVHLAPGSVLLGAAKAGTCAYIGAGAVVIQGCAVRENVFVKALTVHA